MTCSKTERVLVTIINIKNDLITLATKVPKSHGQGWLIYFQNRSLNIKQKSDLILSNSKIKKANSF